MLKSSTALPHPFVLVSDEQFSVSSAVCSVDSSVSWEDWVDESLASGMLLKEEVSLFSSPPSMLLLLSEKASLPISFWILGTRKGHEFSEFLDMKFQLGMLFKFLHILNISRIFKYDMAIRMTEALSSCWTSSFFKGKTCDISVKISVSRDRRHLAASRERSLRFSLFLKIKKKYRMKLVQ